MRTVSTFKLAALAALSFLLGVAAILVYPIPLSRPGVSVEVAYVRYACGECYVQHRILKASGPDGDQPSASDPDSKSLSPARFIGWDVLVFYKGDDNALSTYLDKHYDKTGSCIEPTFRLTGQMKRRLFYALVYRGDNYDGTYFDALSAVAIRHTSPACKQRSGEEAV